MSDKLKPSRCGARPGEGRKKDASAYGESTKAIRVPESMITEVKTMLSICQQQFKQLQSDSKNILSRKRSQNSNDYSNTANISSLLFPAKQLRPVNIPLFNSKVAAGFPFPAADDYIEKTLDLNNVCQHNTAEYGL